MNYFYDAQLKRYLLQFIRIFSDLKIEEQRNGGTVHERVPVLYGDPSRMVANILRNNSENTIMPSPAMSVWIQSLEQDPGRRQDTTFVSKKNINERGIDANGEYTDEIGNQYSLERLMPVPYKLTLQLDLWTTNTTTKMQIVEQIATWFNDRIELQSSSNIYDWTCLFEVILVGIQWTNRSIPQGTDSERDVASLTFELPIWISPPAKLKTKRWIEQVVTNIKDVANISDIDASNRLLDPMGCFGDLDQIIISPDNIKLLVQTDGDTIATLVNTDYTWDTLFDLYNLNMERARLYLKTDNDIDSEDGDIIAEVSFQKGSKIANLTIDTDTIPVDTIAPIIDIVNPQKRSPGNQLPVATIGQRYLLTSDVDHPNDPVIESTDITNPWGILSAYEGDIVMWDGNSWKIDFDTSLEIPAVVSVLSDNSKLKFDRSEWVYLFEGEFNPGYWRLFGSKN